MAGDETTGKHRVYVPPPQRRATDHPSHRQKHEVLIHNIDRTGRILYEYVLMTAAIAVLLTTFQTWQVLKRIEHSNEQNNVLFGEQNHILNAVHKTIQDEIARRK